VTSNTSPAKVPDRSAGSFPLLLAAVGAAGVASLLYEVIWVRQLALSLGSTAVAGAIMLSAFLAGLALGSWLASRRVDAQVSPLRSLAKLEVAAAIIGAVSVPMLEYAGRAYVLVAGALGGGPGVAMVLRAMFSLVVMLLPATLFGMAFPLASAAAVRIVGPERSASFVSAFSSFGSAIGAALGGLVLEPLLGIVGSAMVAVAFNLIAAALAWIAAPRGR
jgi:spermidine synthase